MSTFLYVVMGQGVDYADLSVFLSGRFALFILCVFVSFSELLKIRVSLMFRWEFKWWDEIARVSDFEKEKIIGCVSRGAEVVQAY